MTAPPGTLQTFQAIGNREDLSDVINEISPMDTPFYSNVAHGKASSHLHEWQTDSLASPNASNAVIEGDDGLQQLRAAIGVSRIGVGDIEIGEVGPFCPLLGLGKEGSGCQVFIWIAENDLEGLLPRVAKGSREEEDIFPLVGDDIEIGIGFFVDGLQK